MSKKRSFFERLTGSVLINNEETPLGAAAQTKAKGPGAWPEEGEGEGELAVDVYQTPTEIVIQAMVAGVKPEDLEVAITREMVTIKGKREPLETSNPENYFQKELYWGSFSRTILLPAEVEVEESEAVEKQGLLTLRLSKIDKEKSQTLKIKSL